MSNESMSNEERIEAMEAVFGHRLKGEPDIGEDWIVWDTHTSPRTLAKFVGRARKARIPGVFARQGAIGCRAAE